LLSAAQWQKDAPPFWLFCLPAVAWVVCWLAWWRCRRPAPAETVKLTLSEVSLRWLAGILAVLALTDAALHLVPPHFPVNERTLALARKYLVQPTERTDFEALACLPIWRGQKLNNLLEHVELANYNRELINWQLGDQIYRDFVLSPVIKPATTNQQVTGLDWRRPLWEEFYPRIRHESSPEDAAKIVVRHLRERVTIASLSNPPREVPAIWLQQITDESGFEIIYVAALRSVGVPARLDSHGQAEMFAGSKWQPSPQPAIMSW
jgi:hypothetical protein